MTMTNWERIVANTPEFQKIKNFRKLRKAKHTHKDHIEATTSSTADLSDASSIDFSPKSLSGHTPMSLKTKKRRLIEFGTKSISLGSILNLSSSSDDCCDDLDDVIGQDGGCQTMDQMRSSPLRSISAPPDVAQPIRVKINGLGKI